MNLETRRAAPLALIAEDDKAMCRLVANQIAQAGYEPLPAHDVDAVRAALREQEPKVALVDIRLPGVDGVDLVREVAEQCPVVALTAYGSIDNAVQAMHAGAAEYLVKPVSRERMLLAMEQALRRASIERDLAFLRDQAEDRSGPRMIGDSPAFQKVQTLIDMVAATDATVLIEGESGTGKELVAGAVHARSPRAGKHFVAIDCCTLHENLLESELFGHERGAFTGADRRKQGLIEVAEGGTVFLDEIGEISPTVQAKLLRVIETGGFRRVGGAKDLRADVRFVSATNRSLAQMARDGTFRLDLFYRLSAMSIPVPPLRERREDIAAMAAYLLSRRKFLRHVRKQFDPAAEAALSRYHWPGNARELRNVVERAALMSGESPVIGAEHLTLAEAPAAQDGGVMLSFPHEPTLEEIEGVYLAELLKRHDGHRRRIAEALGVSERNTYRLLAKHGLGAPKRGG